MNTNATVGLALAVACALLAQGCKRSEQTASKNEPKITGSSSDAPVSLVPKWRPGQRYVMRMESDQTMEMPDPAAARRGKASDKTIPIQNTFAQEYSITVTNAPDGNQGLELEILAIELLTGGAGQMINYDSRNTVARDPSPFADVLDKVIGGKLRCLISPENNVLKVEGLDELFARVEATPPEQPQQRRGRAAPMQAAAAGMVRGIYNESVIKQMLEFSTGIPRSLRVGQSWPVNREIAQPQMGTVLLKLTNTFRGWQEHDGKKCARVEFAGAITSKEEADAAGTTAITLRDGVISGRYWFSPEMLLPVETSVEQSYTIRSGGQGNGPPAGFTAPVQQTVSLRLLEMTAVAP